MDTTGAPIEATGAPLLDDEPVEPSQDEQPAAENQDAPPAEAEEEAAPAEDNAAGGAAAAEETAAPSATPSADSGSGGFMGMSSMELAIFVIAVVVGLVALCLILAFVYGDAAHAGGAMPQGAF